MGLEEDEKKETKIADLYKRKRTLTHQCRARKMAN